MNHGEKISVLTDALFSSEVLKYLTCVNVFKALRPFFTRQVVILVLILIPIMHLVMFELTYSNFPLLEDPIVLKSWDLLNPKHRSEKIKNFSRPVNSLINPSVKRTSKVQPITCSCFALLLAQLDLASVSSIKTFVHDFMKKKRRLNILINNAAVKLSPKDLTRKTTVDGNELTLGTNYLGQ